MKFGDNFRKERLDEGSMPSTSTQKNQLGSGSRETPLTYQP